MFCPSLQVCDNLTPNLPFSPLSTPFFCNQLKGGKTTRWYKSAHNNDHYTKDTNKAQAKDQCWWYSTSHSDVFHCTYSFPKAVLVALAWGTIIGYNRYTMKIPPSKQPAQTSNLSLLQTPSHTQQQAVTF
jgi:hypothetical protein